MSQQPQHDEQETATVVEVQPEASLSLITKAEIDMQISTAKAFPRSITQFIRKVMSIATVSADVAESCFYALPRAGKFIEGPSVRLAEIVAASYGNLRTGARVVYKDDKKVVAQGIVHDLEGNIYHCEEVERSLLQHVWEDDPARPGKRRKTGKMETVNEDMQIVIGRAACSIAYRNAMFKVVPVALVKDVETKIKEVAKGTAETLVERRSKRIEYLKGLGVTEKQICSVLEIKDVNDIDLDKLQILQGLINSLKIEGNDLASVFPHEKTKKEQKAEDDTAAKLKKKAEEKKPTEQQLQEEIARKQQEQQGGGAPPA